MTCVEENVRDINSQKDIPMTLGHYMRSMKQLTKQWTPTNFREERRQRLYLKDIDCPPEWHETLQKIIPPNIFYMNENITDKGGNESNNGRDGELFRTQVQSAPAGDLMSSLPEQMRAQNLMCYVGHEGTYTPAHREMCASLGQNIMVEASGTENDEKPGSSIWFMTETKDREVVREYFLSMLGHDIEIEKHFAQINAWKKATFPVYVVEQKPGDFILIPPLAPHQVWNRGTRTMKVAWNRTTVETLEMAIREALPKAKLVCRDEQYKNKAIIYYTLKKYAAELSKSEESDEMGLLGLDADLIRTSPRTEQLTRDFRRLFALFSDILTDEMFATKEKDVEFIPFDSCITCSYCRSNIFNRFLTCKHCIRPLLDGDEDTYDVCMECYAMGRSCLCVSGLRWCEQWNWSELVDNYEHWRTMIIRSDGFVDLENSPLPLELARRRRGKKSLAQVCQEALKRRPFKDITKPEPERVPSESEPELDDEGRPKKKKRRRKPKVGETRRCHVCCHPEYTYKVQICSNPECSEAYCYGVLYRAFDMMPQAVQESEYWECPKCLKICNCGGCRRSGATQPYVPRNTLLGHDTRPIADDRSVEVLVDFRMHNLTWLKVMGEESRSNNSRRMQRLREQADIAKSQDPGLVTNEVLSQEAQNVAGPPLLPPPSTNGHDADNDGDVEMTGNGHVIADDHLGPDVIRPEGPTLPPDHPLALVEAALLEEGDTSTSYPDPSMMGPQRMIGMGYYEQDDSPDKILFDPYQMPTAESMVLDEPDVPEYLKKSIRALKRKARQENEDPEFKIRPRYERKKPRRDPHEIEFIEVDPALFATPRRKAAEANHGEAASASNGANVAGDSEAGSSVGEEEADEIYRPSLRGAKPLHSYADFDDLDELLDDPNNLVPAREPGEPPRRPRPREPTNGATPTPKKRGRPPRSANAATTSPATGSPAAEGTLPRKRGRPKSRLSNVVSAADADAEAAELTTAPLATMETVEADDYKTLDDELQVLAADLEKELERDLGHNVDDAEEVNESVERSVSGSVDMTGAVNPVPVKRRPGRPRRSETSVSVLSQFEEQAAPVVKRPRGRPRRSETAPLRDSSRSPSAPTEAVKRPRGRPRRSEHAHAVLRDASRSPSPPVSAPPSSMKMMSMAERMKLKGKKFKIGQRKPQASASSSTKTTPVRASISASKGADEEPVTNQLNEEKEQPKKIPHGRKELVDNAYNPAAGSGGSSPENSDEESDSDAGTPELPSPPRRWTVAGRSSGPTVVKLGDVESDEEGQEDEEEEDDLPSSDDDFDDGIPARRARGGARGRGTRGRGRGRGRGRPRGRPRRDS